MTYQGGYAGTDGHHPHGHRARSGCRAARTWPTARRVGTRRARCASAPSATSSTPRRPTCCVSDPDTLGPIVLAFKTQTYDLEVGNSNVLGGKHILTYGGNLRQQQLRHLAGPGRQTATSSAPTSRRSTSSTSSASPRAAASTSSATSPTRSSRPASASCSSRRPTTRSGASFNRAFVSPSLINNYLDQNISVPTADRPARRSAPLAPPPLRPLVPPPFLLTVNAYGNPGPEGGVTSTPTSWPTRARSAGRPRWGSPSTRTTPTTTSTSPTLYPTRAPRAARRRPTTACTNPAKGVTVPTATTPAQPITLSPVLMGDPRQHPAAVRRPDPAARRRWRRT